MLEKKSTLHHYFEQFPDHRINRNKKHLLSDIIILSILGVLCGAESWDSIEAFGKTKLGFLKGFLKLPHGI
ncbi:transposase family protein, partial [Sphingobacterium athyrii]|uniref:transposase family protein n=1 Tax=Sphingobacterium athyrii TaxID=2152717 RepID=UPI001C6336EB